VDLNQLPEVVRQDIVQIREKRMEFKKNVNDFINGLSESQKEDVFAMQSSKRKRDASDTPRPLKVPVPLNQVQKADNKSKTPRKVSEEETPKKLPKSSKKQTPSSEQRTLSSFFFPVSKKKDISEQLPTPQGLNRLFLPFTLKPQVTISSFNPLWKQIDQEKAFSEFDSNLDIDLRMYSVYLVRTEFKKKIKQLFPKHFAKPLIPRNANDQNQKWKLLQFQEDIRPPYFGTWSRCSASVTGRTPFSNDKSIEYAVDSEAEWEEDEPGEELVSENEEEDDIAEEDDDQEVKVCL
jgi:chromatin assembly factor 1 subunit A